MKKTVILLTVLCMLLFNAIPCSATSVDNESEAQSVIYKMVGHENSQNWNAYIGLQVKANQSSDMGFFANDENKKNLIGLFNVQSAKVKEIRALPDDEAQKIISLNSIKEKYSEIQYFLVGIDYKAKKEDKYFFNGVNYRIIILAKEEGVWRVVRVSDAPLEALVLYGYGFNSEDEKVALKIIKERYKGNIINKDGVLLSQNKNESVKVNKKMLDDVTSMSTMQTLIPRDPNASNIVQPSYIRVYNTTTKVVTAPEFINEYLKNVLPNEWSPSWPTESLRAGAMACKTYAWYCVLHPLLPNNGADVSNDTSAGQVYIPGSATYATSEAMDYVNGGVLWGYSIINGQQVGYVFFAEYRKGTPGQLTGTQGCGILYQYGTKYMAENYPGYTFFNMCDYYYSCAGNYPTRSALDISIYAYGGD